MNEIYTHTATDYIRFAKEIAWPNDETAHIAHFVGFAQAQATIEQTAAIEKQTEVLTKIAEALVVQDTFKAANVADGINAIAMYGIGKP